MIRIVKDEPVSNGNYAETNLRNITLQYDNRKDKPMLQRLYVLLSSQPNCSNCKYHYYEGAIGYQAHACKKHGILEVFDHPMHDMDATKCVDYMVDKE